MTWICTYLAVSILLGVAACFWGEKLYFPLLSIGAFLATFPYFNVRYGINTRGVLISLGLGVLAALLARTFYKFGVFLIGMAGGAALGLLLSGFLGGIDPGAKLAIILGIAIIIGICAVRWCELFIMLSTAFSGAALIAAPITAICLNFRTLQNYVRTDAINTMIALDEYINSDFTEQHAPLLLTASIMIGLIGFLHQKQRYRP